MKLGIHLLFIVCSDSSSTQPIPLLLQGPGNVKVGKYTHSLGTLKIRLFTELLLLSRYIYSSLSQKHVYSMSSSLSHELLAEMLLSISDKSVDNGAEISYLKIFDDMIDAL